MYDWVIGIDNGFDVTDVYVKARTMDEAIELAHYQEEGRAVVAMCSELGIDRDIRG